MITEVFGCEPSSSKVCFKCTVHHTGMKFCHAFNRIYAKICLTTSELISFEFFRSYCLPLIFYATEALEISTKTLCWATTLVELLGKYSVTDRQNIL